MSSRERHELRLRIAQATARLLHEGGPRDYGQARRKAARSLGIDDPRLLPDAGEIEEALREHVALFGGAGRERWLRAQRRAAREAMVFLARFQPRLTGPVLTGTADRHGAIELHLFAEPPEEVALFLADHGIRHRAGERRLRLDGERQVRVPTLAFSADDHEFELTVLPLDGLRQAPRDPLDGRPMPRAALPAVDDLLAG